MVDVPPFLGALIDSVASMRGAVAVVLGGSRALGAATPESDWDLGVYYRGALDTAPLSRFGQVHAPGSWGRIMNGGAWLHVHGVKVDVLFRDIDVVEHWSACAAEGRFEIDALLGYVAGIPTYSVLAERAVALVLRGELAAVGPFPRKLAESAPDIWRFRSDFSLAHARMRAERADLVGTAGQVAKAVIEEAHARLCSECRWTLNEKRIVENAGLEAAHRYFASIPSTAGGLLGWVAEVAAELARGR
jgi:hypothetical protein